MASTARLTILIALAAGLCGSAGRAQSQPPTNLQLLRSLAGSMGTELRTWVEKETGDSAHIALSVLPRETGWFLEDTLAQTLAADRADSVSDIRVEVGMLQAGVAYSNIRSAGLFGPKLMDRRVTLALKVRAVRKAAGGSVYALDMKRDTTDTIFASDAGLVESSALPFTRAPLPPEGWFSTFAEPLIVVGAVAIAVLLLFSVRS